MNNDPSAEAKEAVVLDAEGHVLHDPRTVDRKFHSRQRPHVKVVRIGGGGLFSNLLIGAGFAVLFAAGLAFAGVVLAIFLVFYLLRTALKPTRR